MASPENQHCANCIGTLSFPMRRRYGLLSPLQRGMRVRLLVSSVSSAKTVEPIECHLDCGPVGPKKPHNRRGPDPPEEGTSPGPL